MPLLGMNYLYHEWFSSKSFYMVSLFLFKVYLPKTQQISFLLWADMIL